MYKKPSMVQVLCLVVAVCKLVLIGNSVDSEQVRGRKERACVDLAGIKHTNLYVCVAPKILAYCVLEGPKERASP